MVQSDLTSRFNDSGDGKGLADLLQNMIRQFLGDGCSSISEDEAGRILASVLYCIQICPAEVDTADPYTAFQAGSAQIKQMLTECEQDWRLVAATHLDIPLISYQETILKALPAFFRYYNPTYAAQETTTMIDYPLATDERALTGIRYIRHYLDRLLLEERFCHYFRSEDILRVLQGYARLYRTPTKEIMANLMQIILEQAIIVMLADGQSGGLRLSSEQATDLIQRLEPDRVAMDIDQAAERLLVIMGLSAGSSHLVEHVHGQQPESGGSQTDGQAAVQAEDPSMTALADYIRACLPSFRHRATAAVAHGHFARLMIIN